MSTKNDTAGLAAVMPEQTPESFLRLPQVLARVPVSKSSLLAWVRAGKFPKPIKLGPMTTVWRASDVAVWVAKASEVQL